MSKQVVEFDFSVGDIVLIRGLENSSGYVMSLWYSDRGPRYEVAYYCSGERSVTYFMATELTLSKEKGIIGYGGKK